MTVDLTTAQWKLVRDLLRHRSLKLRMEAAYVAYSTAYNNSPKRQEEQAAQEEGAKEVDEIIKMIEAVGRFQ